MGVVNDPAVIVSAAAAMISAFFAGLTFMFSRKMSRRDKIDHLKIEILQIVSNAQGRSAWIRTLDELQRFDADGDVRTVRVDALVGLLSHRYHKSKWFRLFPAALEELKNEGYSNLLGMKQGHLPGSSLMED